jgi:rfaE bifunctional protein kinase chain/domain
MINQDLTQVFSEFNQIKVLIIGDVMIDSYLWGDVNRISPEAPVPIVNVKKREKRLGGAANVAMNIKSLGASPILCSMVGQDSDAEDLIKLLQENEMSSEGILQSPDRVTTIKHRILAGHQQMLRVDAEITHPINETERVLLWQKIQTLLPQVQVVIFEDYDKGVLDQLLINQVISLANELNIPTVVDPKKRNFLFYEKATLFKPNLKELKEGLKIEFEADNLAELKNAVNLLRQKLKTKYAFVTLSERGVYISGDEVEYHQKAFLRTIADVSGAGDTVISVAALAMAMRLSPQLLAALANLAGGLVCEYVGVVSINKEKLLSEAIRNNLENL